MKKAVISHTHHLAMTQLIRIIAFSVLIIAIATACDTPVSEVQPSGEAEAVSTFENLHSSVGDDHNAALTAVLDELKTLDTSDMTKEELKTVALNELERYATERGWDWSPSEDLVRLAEDIGADTSGDPIIFSEVVPEDMRASLTSRQTHYVDEVTSAMSAGLSADVLDAELSTIESNAVEELGEEDARVVLETSSVARSTMQYWDANYDEWASLTSEGSDATGETEFAIPVPLADAIGGALGGRVGATVASVAAVIINIWFL
jgi:hypothetical protein